MGKGAAKYGYKSGILPSTRRILKNPTVNQTGILERVKEVKPKGINGVGYAKGIKHPKGSHRNPPPLKFIDVEEVIYNTVKPKSENTAAASEQQLLKQNQAELRRKYLSESLRNEEQRLLKQEELLKKKERVLQEQREAELKELNKERSSNLTIPTLEGIMNQPLMRQRTAEEQEILDLKRKHNKELIEFKAKERKLANLVQLCHAADHFIVTEEQLVASVEKAFASDNQDVLRNKLSLSTSQQTARNEGEISDALFGTLGNGKYVGLPIVKEFLSGEMEQFNQEINTKLDELTKQAEERKDSIL
ncbi:Pet123 [Kluyveromyces lactis]|nr:Pet123 [Kluyveromyces lactis]